MSRFTFNDFIQLKEFIGGQTHQELSKELEGGDTDPSENLKKLQRFLLLALASQGFHELQTQLQTIAATDQTGEMPDLLHNIDWSALRAEAKKLLRKWDKKAPGASDEEEEDGPVNMDKEKEEKVDRVKPPFPDSGQSDNNEG